MTINFIPEYLESGSQLVRLTKQLSNSQAEQFIFVDCVDNTKTRHFIYQAVSEIQVDKKSPRCVVLSSGNEERAGQIVASFHTGNIKNFDTMIKGYQKNNEFMPVITYSTPKAIEIFPNSMRPLDKLPTEQSCAEHAVSAPQNISANITAANVLFNYLNRILTGEVIRDFLTIFNTKTGGQHTYFLNETDLFDALRIEDKNNPYLVQFFTKTFLKKQGFSKEVMDALEEAKDTLVKESAEAVVVRHQDHTEVFV